MRILTDFTINKIALSRQNQSRLLNDFSMMIIQATFVRRAYTHRFHNVYPVRVIAVSHQHLTSAETREITARNKKQSRTKPTKGKRANKQANKKQVKKNGRTCTGFLVHFLLIFDQVTLICIFIILVFAYLRGYGTKSNIIS